MNNDIFLTEEQLYGSSTLDVIKKRGTKAIITDYAILLGGYVSNINNFNCKIGSYFTNSCNNESVGIVHDDGKFYYTSLDKNDIGIRLVLPYEITIPSNGTSNQDSDGILKVEYGYYPQDTVSTELEAKLDTEFFNNNLKKNISMYFDSNNIAFVYEYKDKKFIRTKANFYRNRKVFTLSNGKEYKNGDYVWIEVKPVTWFIDVKSSLMIMEKIIFNGVSFKGIYDFLSKYLMKEMLNVSNIKMIKLNNGKDYSMIKKELDDIKKEIEYYKKQNEELKIYNEKLSIKNKQYKVTYEKLKFMR